MRSSVRVIFYLRKNYVNREGKVGIMTRLTVSGEVCQFSAKLDIDPDLWDTANGRAHGRTTAANTINSCLENMKSRILSHHRELENGDFDVTAEKLKNIFLGIKTKQQTILELFKVHNENFKALVGKNKSIATLQKYEVTYRRLEDFMRYKYNISDIGLREVNHMFICDFKDYLIGVCNCNNNTAGKFLQFFKRIVIMAKNNGWIDSDPFSNYKIRLTKVDRGYLTEQELDAILKKKFKILRLEQVRDVFLFSCFTGLSYIDIKNLKSNNIKISFDGNLWIMTKRKKTDVQSNIPLLEIPKLILDKYSGKLENDLVVPILSNQKMNAYLKEIGEICEIDKVLTFHLARHTFATTITLAKGVSIESVSKMLGHTNIRTTQIYARITDGKIGNDMADLSLKIEGMKESLIL